MGCIVVKEKKKEEEESNDQSEEWVHGGMESLQIELIMEILSWVPTLELPKLRYVCKRWNDILKDPLFPRLHHSHSMLNPNENRVLVLKQRSELYFVDLSNQMSPIDLPCIPQNFLDYKFIGSCNGILCLGSKESSQIFILNPFTRQHLFIPMPLKSGDDNKGVLSWGFGFDEISQLFKVVVFFKSRKEYGLELDTRICDLGNGESANWRNLGITNLSHVFDICDKCYGFDIQACLVNGRLHWPCRQGAFLREIISFDLADEGFRPIPSPDDCQFNPKIAYFNITVLRGRLCIFVNKFFETLNAQLWVMLEYDVKASWVKIFDTKPEIPEYVPDIDHYVYGATLFQALGSIKDGEMVIRSYDGAILICCDSRCELKLFLLLGRSPIPTHWIVHTSSLNWI